MCVNPTFLEEEDQVRPWGKDNISMIENCSTRESNSILMNNLSIDKTY